MGTTLQEVIGEMNIDYLSVNKKCFKKTDMIDTQCPLCKTRLSDKDANVKKGTIYCPSCHKDLSFPEAGLKLRDKRYKRIQRHTTEGIDIREGNHQLILDVSPKASGKNWLLLLFWGVFLIIISSLFIYMEPLRLLIHFWSGIAMIVFFVLGIVALVKGIKRLFRHVRIKVDKQNIVFHYNLFGWLPIGRKVIEVNKVKQIFTTQVIERPNDADSDSRAVFEVKALFQDKKVITLISGLRESSISYFIEKQLEWYLDIKSMVVRGEHISRK